MGIIASRNLETATPGIDLQTRIEALSALREQISRDLRSIVDDVIGRALRASGKPLNGAPNPLTRLLGELHSRLLTVANLVGNAPENAAFADSEDDIRTTSAETTADLFRSLCAREIAALVSAEERRARKRVKRHRGKT